MISLADNRYAWYALAVSILAGVPPEAAFARLNGSLVHRSREARDELSES